MSSFHGPFSKLSLTFDPTIMQAAGHLHNLRIVFKPFIRPTTLKDIAMKTANKTPFLHTVSILTASFFALGCGAISGQALAQQPSTVQAFVEYMTYPVGYSDLDVSKLKGAKVLYLRIRHAADELCESAASWGKKEGNACIRKTVDDAVARVGVPLLTQYYELRSKRDRAGLVQLAKSN
jgi:UrcA family protein